MASQALIDASAVVEPWIARGLAAAAVVLLADRLFEGRGGARAPGLDAPMSRRTERRALGVVLAVATIVRVVGWDAAVTPVFWFSEIATLFVDRMQHDGSLWTYWAGRLWATQVIMPHESAVLLPVLAALQWALGPRFGLPVLGGAVFGVLGVLLAWVLGRRVRSQAFGLAFAALVAVSPMMVTWSRLGPLCTSAVPHVLLATLVGWEAGRRGSVLLAVVAGLVAWTSVYQYHGARVAIPLAALAIVAGGQRAWLSRRAAVLVIVAGAAFAGTLYALHGGMALGGLWPAYGSYAGNKGERTLAEFVSRNLPSVRVETVLTIERYFLRRRSGWEGDVHEWGVQNGGLVFVPVALLGLAGLVSVCRQWRRQWIWLALGAAGLALPALSVMTSRRALVFDLAWCALAAHGLLATVDVLGRPLAPATRRRLAAGAVGLLGAWSIAAVFALDAALPAGTAQQIPFAESGFGDGIACKRCLDAAKQWEGDIAGGAFVVLFDNDVLRENRTSPGGLAAYGKIATLAAGVPDRFLAAYPLMANFDIEPPTPGAVYDRTATDFPTELVRRIERAAPARIVWHFERPTAWERWLAGRLVAAGGTPVEFATPLSSRPGLQVVTPWDRRDAAFAVLRELALGHGAAAGAGCVSLVARGRVVTAGAPVFTLAADGAGLEAPPDWLATSYVEHVYGTFRLTAATPVGAYVGRDAAGVMRVELLGTSSEQITYDLPSLRRAERPPLRPGRRHGLDCGAWIHGGWWLLDPWTGLVASADPAAAALPRGGWMGLAAGPANDVVLASGEQMIVTVDLATGRETARFPARVTPWLREMADECVPLAVGDGWVATVDMLESVVSVYGRTGRDLGRIRLDGVVNLTHPITAIAGAGRYLGIAVGPTVRTFEVRIDPACTPGGAGAP